MSAPAVLAADAQLAAQQAERRRQGAKKAVVTRQRRTAKKVYEPAKHLIDKDPIGPRTKCAICGRGLADRQSIERGIGSECWGDVLDSIAAIKLERVAAPPAKSKTSASKDDVRQYGDVFLPCRLRASQ